MCSKSLKGMTIVKLYKNIKISEASAAPENRFLMRCTVSGVHLTGGMLVLSNVIIVDCFYAARRGLRGNVVPGYRIFAHTCAKS